MPLPYTLKCQLRLGLGKCHWEIVMDNSLLEDMVEANRAWNVHLTESHPIVRTTEVIDPEGRL